MTNPLIAISVPRTALDWFGISAIMQMIRAPSNWSIASAARSDTPGISRIRLRLIDTATKMSPGQRRLHAGGDREKTSPVRDFVGVHSVRRKQVPRRSRCLLSRSLEAQQAYDLGD